MSDTLMWIFLLAFVLSVYFLVRWILRAAFGGETSGYKKKLAVSFVVMIISFALLFLVGLFYEEDEGDMREEAEHILEELLEENFSSQQK